MPCIHGLVDINCPTCRIMKFSLPKNNNKINGLYTNSLKLESPFFKLNSKENENFVNEIKPILPDLHKNFINIISTPSLLNKLPSFENKMLLERLGEIEVSKSDVFNLSETPSLANPEWKVKKED